MVRVLQKSVFGDRLTRLGQAGKDPRLMAAVHQGAELIAQEMRDSITQGAISGPGHVPSSPGEPPNADTHELDQSIHVTDERSQVKSTVHASAAHALPLEFGTSRMAARPFAAPAAQKKRPEARNLVRDAINQINRGG